jgi:hypothetical protein
MAVPLALVLFALAASAAFLAIRMLRAGRAGPRWWAALAALLAAGTAAGVWCGVCCEYQVSDRLRVFSFPVPAAFFHLEDGLWMDYVTAAPALVACCNVGVVPFASVLPLTAAYLWRRRHAPPLS